MPSVEWLLYSAVRQEALLTSQIEGTQATLTDLFDDEAGQVLANTADVEEVTNYLRAWRLVRDNLRSEAGAGIELPKEPSDKELSEGLGLPAFTLDEAENSSVADVYVGIVQQFLELGYEVLVADRGWWAAQDPWKPEVHAQDAAARLPDGTSLQSWAAALTRRGAVDVWAYGGEGG